MKKIELLLGLLSISAVAYRFLFWKELDTVALMSALSLAFLYLYFSTALLDVIEVRSLLNKKAYAGKPTSQIILALVTGFGLALAIIGAIFDFMLWPGGSFQLVTGLIVLSIAAAISVIMYLTKRKEQFYLSIIKRAAIVGGITAFFLFLPQKQQIEMYYRDYPEYVELYHKALDDPDNLELWQKVDEERPL